MPDADQREASSNAADWKEASSNAADQREVSSPVAAGRVGVAIAISRVLGLVRESVQAGYFGAGFASDAFYVAYRIPNLLRDLSSEGAFSAAFLPAFTRRLTSDGQESAWLLANRLINLLLVFVGALTLAFLGGARLLVWLQAAGFAAIPGKLELATLMTRIMAPFLLCASLSSVFMAMLNARGVFFLPALASSIFNIGCIVAGIFLSPFMPRWGLEPVVSLAVGALAGGLGQIVIMLPAARRLGYHWRWTFSLADPDLRRIGRMMLPAILGLSALQINIIIDNQLASSLGDGPVSWLNYAFRLTQFPIGVFGVAIAMVAATDASRYVALRDFAGLRRGLGAALRLCACLSLPAMAGLVVFRQEIVRLLFERDEFLPADTLATAAALLYYAGALFACAAVKIMAPAFYALDDSRTPARACVLTVAVKIALSLLLIKPLGFLGLALSTTLAAWLNFALLWRRLDRAAALADTGRAADDGGGYEGGGKSVTVYAGIALAALSMGVLSRLVFLGSGYIVTGSGLLAQSLRLGTGIVAAIVVLVPLLRLFRVPEAEQLWLIAVKTAGKFRGK